MRPGSAIGMLTVMVICIQTTVTTKKARADRPNRPEKEKRHIPDEQRLMSRVFRSKSYDNSVRPVYNATDNVVVNFSVTLIQVMDMDEKNQVLVTNVWLEHSWVDERIKWDPKEYNNLYVIRIPANKLWLPDIVLYNNADDFTTGYMPSNAMVSYDGIVFWSPPARLRSSCKVDITYFPFDEQRCTMKFGSWTYDQAQVDIVNKTEGIDVTHYITNGEWELIATKIQRNEVIYPIGNEVYPDVSVSFIIHRRILYYILNIILPCVWLNMLSLLAFCLPPDAGEKITLGITVLLSYSVFMLLIAESMPPTSEFVPLIGIYLTVSMAVTSISVILTVGVLKLHHCGPHQTPVPHWMRYLIIKKLGRFLRCQCMSSKKTSNKSGGSKRSKAHRDSKLSRENADVCLRLVNDVNQLNKYSPVAEYRGSVGEYRGSVGEYRGPAGGSHRSINSSRRPEPLHSDSRQTTTSSMPNTNMDLSVLGSDIKRLGVMEEILKYLKIMVAKRDEDDSMTEILDEWREVAQVMDRFLFLLFLTATGTATLLLMIVIPGIRYL